MIMKNYNRKNVMVVALAVCFFASRFYLLFAKEVVLGGKAGWPQLEVSENITTGTGRYGYDCLTIDTNGFKPEPETDLLINFENKENPIRYGKYEIIKNELQNVKTTELGKYAGLSRDTGGLILKGSDGSMFGTEGLIGSFSIEFWLKPSIVENGEIVLQWHSSRNAFGKIIYQMISASFSNGHMEWLLSNIFDLFYQGNDNLIMKGNSTLVPDSWSYHVLSFDAETGLLEYIVDGHTEDLKFITTTGHEGGDIPLVLLGVPANLEICSEYTGQIDDFRLSRKSYSLPDSQSADNAGSIEHFKYDRGGAYFRTKPMMVSAGSSLDSLDVEMDVPSETAVNLYVRSGDNQYNWTDTFPEWKPVSNREEISGVTGLYFQIAAELFPNGDGAASPTITSIKLNYNELPLPLPPFSVKAIAGDGTVTLQWNYSVDETAGGYYVYYGNRSGEYLGRVAVEGASPINVGNVTSITLTGLKNGTIYYFAVATWSKYNENVIGALSKEVFARPAKR